MKNKQASISVLQKFFGNDPVSASQLLETMDEEQVAEVLKEQPIRIVITIINLFNDSFAASVVDNLPTDIVQKLANSLDGEKVANVLMQLSEEKRQALLVTFEDKKKQEVKELLSYPEGSAGRLMSVKVIAFRGDLKLRDAIQKMRKLSAKGFSDSYIYIVDNNNRLIGVMNIRDMLLASGSETLAKYMRPNVSSVNCFMEGEQVAKFLEKNKYFAVPVVDNDQRLLGIVKAEQLMENVKALTIEDIQKMFGASAHEKAFSPISFSLRTRLPWMHVNLLTAFMAASVVALFEDLIAKITALAVFLPIVAGQGGNAGAQSLAVVMRGIVMREIPPHKRKELIIKETRIGLVNGIVIGVVTGIAAWLWLANPFFGVVIGLGMIVNLVAAGFAGAAIPLAMKALHWDPAQSSSIILTTITDVVGFFAFLGFALLFQEYLV